jgi:hypothetical protein
MKRSGFATAYSLIFLLFVTVVGTAILFMSRMGRQDVAQYRDSKASARAAVASLRGVEAQFRSSPKVSLAIVRKFTYLLGDSTGAGTEHKLVITGTSMSYSAKILNVDTVNHLLLVEGTGYDGNGGQKKVTGLYLLDGLSGLVKYPGGVKYALYAGGGIQNINASLSIAGSFYMGNSSNNFNNGASITGDLKTIYPFIINSNFTVGGNATYKTLPTINGSGTFTVTGSKISSSVDDPLKDSLLNPLPTALTSVAVTISNTVAVSYLESQWASRNPLNLYNGWLVMSLNGNLNTITSDAIFTKRVIWLTNGYSINNTWYDCADASNTFIYVTGAGALTIGTPANKRFRGYIYANTTANVIFQEGNGSVFNGAIFVKKSPFNLNGGGTLTINYSDGSLGQTAVQELVDLGLLIPAN